MPDTDTNEAQYKEYSGFLIVNWRNDKVRYRKTPPGDNANPQEFAIPGSVNVDVLEVTVPEIEADITVPLAQVEQAVTGVHADPVDDDSTIQR